MNRVEPSIGSISLYETNPYLSPDAGLLDEASSVQPVPRLFDFSGRLSLSRFWLWHLIFAVCIPWTLLFVLYLGLRHNLYALIGACLAVIIPSALLELGLLMRRARDVAIHPGWGAFALLVPLVGSLVWLFLGLIPGGKRQNRYGAANPPLPLWAKLLIPMLLLGVPCAGMMVGLAYPELMKTLPLAF
ncbi:DUF805 domain-containing protein [Aquipseudomonas campi]|uniref:DUF805 domain-containing protein n=1 Tax=Aquipseudomonas campi TaxID=2731681 RepID=A0A6M8G730_9GAMM|nr:DUF805 domain-containing protein [Pseudomonas campi]QKE64695.1 DUF805 domain-containing protein [Pseudomonas campi]